MVKSVPRQLTLSPLFKKKRPKSGPDIGMFAHLRDFGTIDRGRSSLLMSIEQNLPKVQKNPRKTPLKDRLFRIARFRKEVDRQRYFANDVSGPISPRAYDNPLGIPQENQKNR